MLLRRNLFSSLNFKHQICHFLRLRRKIPVFQIFLTLSPLPNEFSGAIIHAICFVKIAEIIFKNTHKSYIFWGARPEQLFFIQIYCIVSAIPENWGPKISKFRLAHPSFSHLGWHMCQLKNKNPPFKLAHRPCLHLKWHMCETKMSTTKMSTFTNMFSSLLQCLKWIFLN